MANMIDEDRFYTQIKDAGVKEENIGGPAKGEVWLEGSFSPRQLRAVADALEQYLKNHPEAK